MPPEIDLAKIATLIGEPTRAMMLSALLSGEALPASELAYRAQITPQTASSHLNKLLEGGLIQVTTIGRHRYYSLKNHEVAQILETLHLVAPLPEPKPPKPNKTPEELRRARTCYDHLAGRLGVTFTDALIEKGYLIQHEEHYEVTPQGNEWLISWQIDTDLLKGKRRQFAITCLDWSERRFHLAGALGAAVTEVFFTNGWIKRIPQKRTIRVTVAGQQALAEQFGIRWIEPAS